MKVFLFICVLMISTFIYFLRKNPVSPTLNDSISKLKNLEIELSSIVTSYCIKNMNEYKTIKMNIQKIIRDDKIQDIIHSKKDSDESINLFNNIAKNLSDQIYKNDKLFRCSDYCEQGTYENNICTCKDPYSQPIIIDNVTYCWKNKCDSNSFIKGDKDPSTNKCLENCNIPRCLECTNGVCTKAVNGFKTPCTKEKGCPMMEDTFFWGKYLGEAVHYNPGSGDTQCNNNVKDVQHYHDLSIKGNKADDTFLLDFCYVDNFTKIPEFKGVNTIGLDNLSVSGPSLVNPLVNNDTYPGTCYLPLRTDDIPTFPPNSGPYYPINADKTEKCYSISNQSIKYSTRNFHDTGIPY